MKTLIYDREGVPEDQQRLALDGHDLGAQQCLSEAGVGRGATIRLLLRLRGGLSARIREGHGYGRNHPAPSGAGSYQSESSGGSRQRTRGSRHILGAPDPEGLGLCELLDQCPTQQTIEYGGGGQGPPAAGLRPGGELNPMHSPTSSNNSDSSSNTSGSTTASPSRSSSAPRALSPTQAPTVKAPDGRTEDPPEEPLADHRAVRYSAKCRRLYSPDSSPSAGGGGLASPSASTEVPTTLGRGVNLSRKGALDSSDFHSSQAMGPRMVPWAQHRHRGSPSSP